MGLTSVRGMGCWTLGFGVTRDRNDSTVNGVQKTKVSQETTGSGWDTNERRFGGIEHNPKQVVAGHV